jgi:signal transduction histidine kinase
MPRRGRSLRTRLAVVIVALVALTSAVLGVGAAVFVERSLRDQLLADATRQAQYDLTVLVPDALGGNAGRDAFEASGVMTTLGLRGSLGTIADFGDGDPLLTSLDLLNVPAQLPGELRGIVARGDIGYAWMTVAGRPLLVVGGHSATGQLDLFFVHDAAEIDRAVTQLRLALLFGSVIAVLIALVTARAVARGILRPIDTAARTAARIADGDLRARVPVESSDELGALAGDFNRMAAAQEQTIERLRSAEAGNRRFVSDVAHELRTPLTALVAEASVLREGLGDLPPATRRAGELLVADVGRLRLLVEDLMELSRFDAGAEQVSRTPVDLGGRVRAMVAKRLPGAGVDTPAERLVVETDPRRLDRIVGNLLDNARDHAPGAPVLVRVSRDGGHARVSVEDHGSAPPPDGDLERLFERFTKADPARPGGSGLGLAIAREHAVLLGGTLTAERVPGGGLRFDLDLPVAAADPEGDPAGEERGVDVAGTDVAG